MRSRTVEDLDHERVVSNVEIGHFEPNPTAEDHEKTANVPFSSVDHPNKHDQCQQGKGSQIAEKSVSSCTCSHEMTSSSPRHMDHTIEEPGEADASCHPAGQDDRLKGVLGNQQNQHNAEDDRKYSHRFLQGLKIFAENKRLQN